MSEPNKANIHNLHVLAYAKGFTLWVYQSKTHTKSEIKADGFFDTLSDMFSVGDHIHVAAQDGGEMVWVVWSNQNAGVRVAP